MARGGHAESVGPPAGHLRVGQTGGRRGREGNNLMLPLLIELMAPNQWRRPAAAAGGGGTEGGRKGAAVVAAAAGEGEERESRGAVGRGRKGGGAVEGRRRKGGGAVEGRGRRGGGRAAAAAAAAPARGGGGGARECSAGPTQGSTAGEQTYLGTGSSAHLSDVLSGEAGDLPRHRDERRLLGRRGALPIGGGPPGVDARLRQRYGVASAAVEADHLLVLFEAEVQGLWDGPVDLGLQEEVCVCVCVLGREGGGGGGVEALASEMNAEEQPQIDEGRGVGALERGGYGDIGPRNRGLRLLRVQTSGKEVRGCPRNGPRAQCSACSGPTRTGGPGHPRPRCGCPPCESATHRRGPTSC